MEDEREVGSGEGEKMAAMWGCNYHETSAVRPASSSAFHDDEKEWLMGRGWIDRFWVYLRISYDNSDKLILGGEKKGRRRKAGSVLYYR